MFENWSEFEVDLSSVRRAVGGGCFVRGSQSSWRQAVCDIDWDPIAAVLCGTVHGKNGTCYAPEAEFVSGARPALFARGRCACVAGGACQHVVALICAALAASGIDLAAAVPAPRPAGSCDRPPSRRGPAADARPTVLVAIEVKLAIPRTHSPRLVSRLVERGPGGDWVHGNLTWGSLETAGRRDTYLAPQVELLRELCALYQAGGQNICGRERLLDLSAVDDDRLWELLDEAVKLNLPLVHAETGEELLPSQEGRFHLDIVVAGPAGGYRMTPVVLTADQEPVLPVAFIGAQQAHGAVCRSLARATDPPGSGRLRLVRLARPVPAGRLQEQALDGGPQEIRAGAEFAFRTREYPWLRQHADVISSDRSFVPPVISAPKLALRIYPRSAGKFDLQWGWDYEADGQRLWSEFERHRDDEEYRSAKAEDDLLRCLDLPLEHCGLGCSRRSGASRPQPIPQARLTGQQAITFLAELLPKLTAEPRVRVEFLRDGADDPGITRSRRFTSATDEVTGISDWFDLDIQFSVAGHVVPLRLVFLALYHGLHRLELPDGACLPLDGPELEGLARLIRESRALVDPKPTTKSRYFDQRVNGLATFDVNEEQFAWWKRWQEWLAQGVRDVEPPAGLRAKLEPHQLMTQTYGHVRRLRAPVKIPVTGTPLENNLEELWSLLSIAAPGLFPSPEEFLDEYAHPIVDKDDQQQLVHLRRRIDPLILRRTKQEAEICLPAKREYLLEVELDPWHREVYETWFQRQREKNLGADGKLVNRYTALSSLTLLRQLCLHAGLIDDAYADLPSAKIDTLLEQLRELISAGHRALVFSQYARFLRKVRTRLEAEGLTCCYLDGRTRGRKHVVKAFQEGAAPVFLISLKAGGTGLNLTQADYCFLLDPWWNPAVEAQAIARIHRIGQNSEVNVYRLIARDTVEQKVRVLQARKGQLFDSVLDGGRALPRWLGDDSLRELFD